MDDGFSQSPLFDSVAVWLMERGLRESSVGDIVQGAGRRLLTGGIPLNRLSVGAMVLNPVFGALDVVWDADDDRVITRMAPRELITTEEFQNAPFFQMAAEKVSFLRQRLDEGAAESEYPIYDRLRAMDVTDYFAFCQSYGRTDHVKWADLPPGMEGILGSFSTRRIGGFADREIAYLKALSLPFSLAIKSAMTQELSKAATPIPC